MAGDMVNVALQGKDFLDVVLLLLLILSDLERCPADLFLRRLHLREQVFVLSADRFDSVLEALDLLASVAIVGQDVLFFDFEGAGHLLGTSLFFDQFLVLSLEELIGVRALAELLVDEPVLPCERLDVFGHLGNLLRFQLGQLGLLVHLLAHVDLLLAQGLYFLLTLEELALIVVLFADNDAHLMLDVAELKALLLKLRSDLDQLLSFLVKLSLHLIKVTIEHGHRLFQVVDLLLLCLQLALVRLNIVDKDSSLILTAATRRHGLLQTLQQLVFGVIQVLDQGSHALDLGA